MIFSLLIIHEAAKPRLAAQRSEATGVERGSGPKTTGSKPLRLAELLRRTNDGWTLAVQSDLLRLTQISAPPSD